MSQRSICFTTHPDSSGDMRTDFLGGPCKPDWAVAEEVKRRKLDYWKLGYEKAYRLVPSKPVIVWLYEFIERISSRLMYCGSYGSRHSSDFYRNWHDELSHDEFSFTFEYHIVSHYCSEESEDAIRVSTPVWIVTIRDHEGTIVHKNWTIRLGARDGDIYLSRTGGDQRDHVHFLNDPLEKLTQAIREYIRIRNFRMKRLGQEVPN